MQDRYDIFGPEIGMDDWMYVGGPILSVPGLADPTVVSTGSGSGSGIPGAPSLTDPVEGQVSLGDVLSGAETGAILAFGKKSFSDCTQGWMQGLDTDATYKWIMGSCAASIDYNVSRAGALTVSLDSSTVSNALYIDDASNSSIVAVDVRRTVGTGSGIYVQCDSPAGYCLDLLQNSNTPAAHIVSAGSGAYVVPVQLENQTATSTNYWKMANYRGGSAPTVSVNQWVGSTDPNGVLDGDRGDLLQSSAGEIYVNTDGSTSWDYLVRSSTFATLFPVVDTTEIIMGSGDSTKRIRFEVDGLTTSTTRVLTVPDADGTMTLLGNDYTGANRVVLDTSPTIITPNVTGDITCTGTFVSSDITAVDCLPYGTGAGETGAVAFRELAANGTDYVSLKAPDSLAAPVVFVLPAADGSANHYLKTDGGGALSFDGLNMDYVDAGTLTVPYGGTGAATFTAYSVLCAGTTATGAFQNVSGVGSSGQVLTSNGAGALPSWQSPSASVSGLSMLRMFPFSAGMESMWYVLNGATGQAINYYSGMKMLSNNDYVTAAFTDGTLHDLAFDEDFILTFAIVVQPSYGGSIQAGRWPLFFGMGDVNFNTSTELMNFLGDHVGVVVKHISGGSFKLYATNGNNSGYTHTEIGSITPASIVHLEVSIKFTFGVSVETSCKIESGTFTSYGAVTSNLPSTESQAPIHGIATACGASDSQNMWITTGMLIK